MRLTILREGNNWETNLARVDVFWLAQCYMKMPNTFHICWEGTCIDESLRLVKRSPVAGFSR